MPEEIQTAILDFYEDDMISFQGPGRDDFKKLRINGEVREFRIRYLLVSVKEAHALFLENSDGMRVSFSKFADLRPVHVRLQSGIPHNVCTCIIHENMKFLLKALHKKHVSIDIEFRKFIAQVVCDQDRNECTIFSQIVRSAC